MAAHYGAPAPEVTGAFRLGDVRHAACEIRAAREQLGWTPAVDLESGIGHLCEWLDADSN